MFQRVKISPSILSADFMQLGDEVKRIEDAGADWVHVDVMDGHFVPNLTMGIPLVKHLKHATRLPLDVHLMIENPLRQIPWFLDAGADIITFHAETLSADETQRAIEAIHDGNALVGLAIKPATPVDAIKPFISELDMVLVMSVEPGFSGQSYIEGTEGKIAEVVQLAQEAQVQPLIQVDGGIGQATLARVVEAGADVLVCGNAVFAADDPALALSSIKDSANSVSAARGASA